MSARQEKCSRKRLIAGVLTVVAASAVSAQAARYHVKQIVPATTPGLIASYGGGINNVGEIAGSVVFKNFSSPTMKRGYLARNGSIVNLPQVTTSVTAAAIGRSGLVGGTVSYPDGSKRPFIWHEGGNLEVQTLPAGYSSCAAAAVNDPTFGAFGGDWFSYWKLAVNCDVPDPQYPMSAAFVYGHLYPDTAVESVKSLGDVHTVYGLSYSSATGGGMNGFGPPKLWDLMLGYDPYIPFSSWGATTDIVDMSQFNSSSSDVRDLVLGHYEYKTPFILNKQTGAFTMLPGLEGASVFPQAINSLGTAVGSKVAAVTRLTPPTTFEQALLWENGTVTDLNSLVDDASVMLTRAVDINDAGQILAEGKVNATQATHAFLLTPSAMPDVKVSVEVPPPPPGYTGEIPPVETCDGWYTHQYDVWIRGVTAGISEIRYMTAMSQMKTVAGSAAQLKFETYYDPANPADLREGVNNIIFRGTDSTGAVTLEKQETVKVDYSYPSAYAASTLPTNSKGWTVFGGYSSAANQKVTLSGYDSGSGVKSISYTAPTTSGTIAGNSGTILMNNEGISTVSFTATDYACHTSFGYTYTVKNDRIPPFTTASITGTPGTNGAFIESAQVTLAATDATSGVAATSFSLDGATWQPYTDPLLITTIGTTTIFYRSTDDADNLEGTKSVSVKIQAKQVDSIPPAVTTTSPVAGTTVSVPSSIAVNFSEVVVNGDTIGSITLKKGKTLIAKSATANGSTLIITPTTALAKGATYTVSIPAGAVKDSAGNALAAAYSFSFTTARR